jgi:hypothetical protein
VLIVQGAQYTCTLLYKHQQFPGIDAAATDDSTAATETERTVWSSVTAVPRWTWSATSRVVLFLLGLLKSILISDNWLVFTA